MGGVRVTGGPTERRRDRTGLPENWEAALIRPEAIPTEERPGWVADAWAAFAINLGDPSYPCFFGGQALREGAIHHSFVSAGRWDEFPSILRRFLERRRHPLANLAVFLEPTPGDTHGDAGHRFWQTLAMLLSRSSDWALAQQRDPEDPLWEFSFDGVQMFVVGAGPTFSKRRSRNLGPCPVMLFQPRDVFEVSGAGKDGGDGARRLIRRRLAAWDDVPHHPALGTYGDPENREWAQYFLPDDNRAQPKVCPLSAAHAAEGTC